MNMGFPTQSKEKPLAWNMKNNNEITDKTVVPDNPKTNMRFKIWKSFWSYYKEWIGQQLRVLEISNNTLKTTKFPSNARS